VIVIPYLLFCRISIQIRTLFSTPLFSFVTVSLGNAVANGCDCLLCTLVCYASLCLLGRRSKGRRVGGFVGGATSMLCSYASPSSTKLRHIGLGKTECVDPGGLAA
jgi:hypothetical protein